MRKCSDIKTVKVNTTGLKLGYIVEIVYKDGKSATFSVDSGHLSEEALLRECFNSVFLQVEAS